MDDPSASLPSPFAPFVFKGWDAPSHIVNPPLNFALLRAAEMETHARRLDSLGQPEQAQSARAAAAWWLHLLQPAPSDSLEGEQLYRAGHAIDALLARSVHSKGALIRLLQLSSQLLTGMCDLAAHDPVAAGHLIFALTEATDRMNNLAFFRPEQFREAVKGEATFPGLLSPNPEKTQQNQELVEKLEVGREFKGYLSRGGTKGRRPSILNTPSNLWADRLHRYINEIIPLLHAEYPAHFGWTFPSWKEEAMKLEPIGPDNWEDWHRVAWTVVLEATSGAPENEPVLHAIGKSAEKKRPAWREDAREGAQAGHVRDRIKYKLREAFKVKGGARADASKF